MFGEIARGLGLGAMFDPPPGPGVMGSLSGARGVNLGNIQLVPSMGVNRTATFREIYLTNPWVYAAVNILSRGVGRAPTYVYELDAEGNPLRIRGDTPQTPGRLSAGASLDRLLSNPTPGYSRNAVIGATIRDKLIYGNALWQQVRPASGGMPTSVQRWPWRKVTKVEVDSYERPLFYEIRRTPFAVDAMQFLPADVVHFGLGSDEGALGISPLESCRYTIALHDAVVRHLLGYFTNSARTSGHLQVEKLTVQKAKEIREMITDMYASPENAGKVMVTSGEWQPTSESPDHSQVIELILLSREEVAAAYTIPPPVIGILDRAIKSNVETLREQFVRDAIGPQAVEIDADIKAQLINPIPSWSSYYSEFNLDEQLKPDLESRAVVYAQSAFWLTIDDIRRLEKLAPLRIKKVTDVPWVLSGSQPVSAWEDGNFPPSTGPHTPTAPPAPAKRQKAGTPVVEDVQQLIALLDDDPKAAARVARTLSTRNGGSHP